MGYGMRVLGFSRQDSFGDGENGAFGTGAESTPRDKPTVTTTDEK